MTIASPTPGLSERLLSLPVNRLLLTAFILIAVVPLIFLAIMLYQESWDNAWREIHEKHRLLAMNLASPISIYVNDHNALLALLAHRISESLSPQLTNHTNKVQEILDLSLVHTDGFRTLSLIDTHGTTRVFAQQQATAYSDADNLFANEACYLNTLKTGKWTLSNIKKSPISGEPTLILTQPVATENGKIAAVLLAELRIDIIEKLRRSIHFGKQGHSAIVDGRGHVIAHPNPQWMREMRDLSAMPIVREMMAGKTGVTEFYSPFVKQDMVAGYTAVPDIGWGIMVPQPKAEVEEQVWNLLSAQFSWGLLGLAFAILLAIPLARWITRPINDLADAAQHLEHNQFNGELPPITKSMPQEINRLHRHLSVLIHGFQLTRKEVEQLNLSLQNKVDEATEQLRSANAKLEILATSDHLTALANRRHFERKLIERLHDPRDDIESMCIMLIDIDNFKEINDKYGHAAGDAVLVQIAPILKISMRPTDLVARYGGDEFVIQMNCSAEVGINRAREIRTYLEKWEFKWNHLPIKTTVSIGLLYQELNGHTTDTIVDIKSLLQRADKAMYEAKKRGRNTVVDVAYYN